jgi:predicted lipid carrier protein YhbT
MMESIARRQHGLTFSGFLVTAILIIFAAVGLMKIVPVYVENRTIQSVLDEIVHDPAMQGAEISEIRNAFYKRGVTMNNITAVAPEDLIIDKSDAGLKLDVKYQVKVPLVGNASLLFDFNTHSH